MRNKKTGEENAPRMFGRKAAIRIGAGVMCALMLAGSILAAIAPFLHFH